MLAAVELAGIKADDCVIWLGDYVDRGPDSASVIEHLCGLDPRKNIFLRGNHEIMMCNARSSHDSMKNWASAGGAETRESYLRLSGVDDGLESIPQKHWTFIENLRPYYESDTHIYVHAAADSELEMRDQFDDDLFWGGFDSIGPHFSGRHVICGHSSQKDGIPGARPHATCIDTWACGGAWLTCLDVYSRQYFQANQYGETNVPWLS